MTKEFTIKVIAPCDCTDDQFDEWVKFCTGYSGSINNSNPLSEYDMEVVSCYES